MRDQPSATVETGVLPTGHPYARIGVGERVVLSIPALAIIDFPTKPASVARQWKSWLGPIERHGLSFVSIARRPDLPPRSSAADVAADYASVIRERWGRAVAVMGISTGGTYASWLAIEHPDLVERLVLAFTAHRVPAEVTAVEDLAIEHALAGRWRAAYAQLGQWFLPKHPRLASAGLWLLGPLVAGRSRDTRALAIDGGADATTMRPADWARSAARPWSSPVAWTWHTRRTSFASSSRVCPTLAISTTQDADTAGLARNSARRRAPSLAARRMPCSTKNRMGAPGWTR